jgi:hypothetical protein
LTVDVTTEIRIEAPPEAVAAYAADPTTAPVWYENISAASWETEPPLRVGSRVRFTAHFLGRRLDYTYEIIEYEPGRHLTMRTAEGPFPMETSYTWVPLDDGATLMRLRNRGNPSGFSNVFGPVMARSMRRANRRDLEQIKQMIESRSL